ncbi:MAG: AraC family transcriptional regulator [Asticcacaulis sp.]|nr:AraC family transcriptional regulator [Asticcacaulis sp.]
MSFLVYTPKPPLSRYVSHLYCPAGPMPYREDRIMPAPFADLKVNFGGAFPARRAGTDETVGGHKLGWCMGVWEEYHSVTWPDDPDFIGVSFRPGGAYAVLGVEASELSNEIVALDDVLGRIVGELRERLYEAPNVAARFALMDQVLTGLIRRRPDVERIAPALKVLDDSHGLAPVANLGDLADISQKHMISLFNRIIGVSPKKLARLYRMQHLLRAVDGPNPVTWTTVAQDYLFFDQAHFNKDFKRFTGYAPTEYLERRRRITAATPDHAVYSRLMPTG